jgi:two-component system, OmpR family, KDP operon response regulator KdpE
MGDLGKPKLLLVEDEGQMRRFLRASLPAHGYALIEAATGEEGIAAAATHNPDIILLDLGLPDLDGLDVTKRLREWTKAPIIVISAREQERDKVAALDAGADDYLTKPFGMDELLARLRVARRHLERRASEKEESTLDAGTLRIDVVRRQVFVRDAEVHLTPIEYKLLLALARDAGRVLTHQQLLKEVWGQRYATQTQYLHVHMGHLRQKLEADVARPRLLLTEPGVGYRLKRD